MGMDVAVGWTVAVGVDGACVAVGVGRELVHAARASTPTPINAAKSKGVHSIPPTTYFVSCYSQHISVTGSLSWIRLVPRSALPRRVVVAYLLE